MLANSTLKYRERINNCWLVDEAGECCIADEFDCVDEKYAVWWEFCVRLFTLHLKDRGIPVAIVE